MSLIKKAVFLIWLTDLTVSGAWAVTGPSADSREINKVDGAKVYLENCSICHGDRGDGDTRVQHSLNPPPRNFTTEAAARELSRERMIRSVTEGRPGTGMVAHKNRLSAAEIVAVVEYIRTRFMTTSPQAGPQAMILPQTTASPGGKIYSKNCAVCHGDRGSSAFWARSGLNPPPRDFTTVMARQELSRDRMIASVTNGRPGTAMMPHKGKLSSQQIEQVVDYIRATFMSGPVAVVPETLSSQPPVHPGMPSGTRQEHVTFPGFGVPGAGRSASTGSVALQGHIKPHVPLTQDPHTRQSPHQQGTVVGGMPGLPAAVGSTAAVDMNVAMPKGLKGNSVKGRKFYMSNCFTCHGVKGDGNGPRAYFNIPRPRDFTSVASRRILNRERLFTSITHGRVGTVMPAWGKVLSDQQIADVAEFVFTTFVQEKSSSDQKTSALELDAGKKKAR